MQLQEIQSLGSMWSLAILSSWMNMTSCISCGHLARIAGKTFSIKHNLITSLVIDDIGFVFNVSATWFLLVRLAGFLYICESKISNFSIKFLILRWIKSWSISPQNITMFNKFGEKYRVWKNLSFFFFFSFYLFKLSLTLKKLNKKRILDEYFNLMYKKLKKRCKSISNGLCKSKIFSIIENETKKSHSNGFSIPKIFFGSWTVAHQVWWATVHSSKKKFLL